MLRSLSAFQASTNDPPCNAWDCFSDKPNRQFLSQYPSSPPTRKTHPWPSTGHCAAFQVLHSAHGLRWLRARTKAALAAAKTRGTRLGATRKAAGAVWRMRVAAKAQAAEFAANILPIIRMTGIGPVCRALSARAYRMRRQRSERRSRDRVRCRAPKCRGAWRIEGRPLSLGTLHCRDDRTSIGDRTSPRLAGLHGCMQ